MTYEHIEELRRELVESVAIQLSHYYEDEEDFEEKFGTTDDIADAVELYLKYKNVKCVKNGFINAQMIKNIFFHYSNLMKKTYLIILKNHQCMF